MVRFMRYSTVFRLYEAMQPVLQYSPPVETRLPGKKALAIAPHPDDESVGCGGSLYLHAAQGGTLEVLYCTSDGEPRDSEAAAAARVLGASKTLSLGYPVESLQDRKDFAERLTAVLEEREPDIVFLPFAIDNHTDHRALNRAFAAAAGKKKFGFIVYAYPVWLPLYPNVLMDIGGAWEKKKEAVSCYASQLATRDYVSMARSQGEYWAAVKGRDLSMVEPFFKASAGEYAALVRKILK